MVTKPIFPRVGWSGGGEKFFTKIACEKFHYRAVSGADVFLMGRLSQF
jgi:hypothetical protein